MHATRAVPRHLQFAFDERLVERHVDTNEHSVVETNGYSPGCRQFDWTERTREWVGWSCGSRSAITRRLRGPNNAGYRAHARHAQILTLRTNAKDSWREQPFRPGSFDVRGQSLTVCDPLRQRLTQHDLENGQFRGAIPLSGAPLTVEASGGGGCGCASGMVFMGMSD